MHQYQYVLNYISKDDYYYSPKLSLTSPGSTVNIRAYESLNLSVISDVYGPVNTEVPILTSSLNTVNFESNSIYLSFVGGSSQSVLNSQTKLNLYINNILQASNLTISDLMTGKIVTFNLPIISDGLYSFELRCSFDESVKIGASLQFYVLLINGFVASVGSLSGNLILKGRSMSTSNFNTMIFNDTTQNFSSTLTITAQNIVDGISLPIENPVNVGNILSINNSTTRTSQRVLVTQSTYDLYIDSITQVSTGVSVKGRVFGFSGSETLVLEGFDSTYTNYITYNGTVSDFIGQNGIIIPNSYFANRVNYTFYAIYNVYQALSNTINLTFTTSKATGGSVSQITVGDVNYTLHEFTTSGTFTVQQSGNLTVDILLVGGGGAGGYSSTNNAGGGGGGGEVVLLSSIVLNTGTNYTVTIGSGGTGGISTATNGSSSSITNISSTIGLAAGGVAGKLPSTSVNTSGSNGGGQGTGSTAQSGGGTSKTPSPTNFKNNGGTGSTYNFSSYSVYYAGGGGGAGGVGGNGSSTTTTPSANVSKGGNGYSTNFTGPNVSYGAGGGGGMYDKGFYGLYIIDLLPAGLGGTGGGGTGAITSSTSSGTIRTVTNVTGYGSGGGGGANSAGGNGSSGVVYIRYR